MAMWGTAATVFLAAGVATLIGTEVVRSLVHRRRERVHGIGGTQDIALWGTLIALGCYIATITCGAIWLWGR